MKKLNLGCGYDYREDFINVDIDKNCKKDFLIDVNRQFPFKDNTFGYVLCNYVLEHIIDFKSVMDEIYRVCENNAIIEIKVPHFSSGGNAYNPYHKLFFNCSAFDTFCYNRENGENQMPSKDLFHLLKNDMDWDGGVNPLNYIARVFNSKYLKGVYEETFLKNIFPAKDIHFRLKVIK